MALSSTSRRLELLRAEKAANRNIVERLLRVRESARQQAIISQYFLLKQLVEDLISTKPEILNISFYPSSFDGRYYVNEILQEFKDEFPEWYGCIRPYPIECYIEFGSLLAKDDSLLNQYFSLVQETHKFIVTDIQRLKTEMLKNPQLTMF